MSNEEFLIEDREDPQVVSPFDAPPRIDAAGNPIEEKIKNLIKRQKVPHLKEIIECLVDEWGGPREIAKALHQTYEQAPVGSTTRSRILEKVISFMQMFAEEDGESEFDDDTLVAIMMEQMQGVKPELHLPEAGTKGRRLTHSSDSR